MLEGKSRTRLSLRARPLAGALRHWSRSEVRQRNAAQKGDRTLDCTEPWIRAGVSSGKYFAANVGRRTFDAFGSPFFFAHQAFVDARRLGVVGFSQGGWVTLSPRTNPLPQESAAHRGCAEPKSHARDWSRAPTIRSWPIPGSRSPCARSVLLDLACDRRILACSAPNYLGGPRRGALRNQSPRRMLTNTAQQRDASCLSTRKPPLTASCASSLSRA